MTIFVIFLIELSLNQQLNKKACWNIRRCVWSLPITFWKRILIWIVLGLCSWLFLFHSVSRIFEKSHSYSRKIINFQWKHVQGMMISKPNCTIEILLIYKKWRYWKNIGPTLSLPFEKIILSNWIFICANLCKAYFIINSSGPKAKS